MVLVGDRVSEKLWKKERRSKVEGEQPVWECSAGPWEPAPSQAERWGPWWDDPRRLPGAAGTCEATLSSLCSATDAGGWTPTLSWRSARLRPDLKEHRREEGEKKTKVHTLLLYCSTGWFSSCSHTNVNPTLIMFFKGILVILVNFSHFSHAQFVFWLVLLFNLINYWI